MDKTTKNSFFQAMNESLQEIFLKGSELDPNSNYFWSPASASLAFALLAEGAQGKSREELCSYFSFDPEVVIAQQENAILAKRMRSKSKKAENPPNLTFSNSIWVSDKSVINEEYQDNIRAKYKA